MNIFKRNYVLRTYSRQTTKKGYAVIASYKDRMVRLNVQPTVAVDLKNLSEGDRAGKSIKSYGDFPVQTADVKKGYRADRLYYAGEWYECVSSSLYEHTPLYHWKSLYVKVSEVDDTDGEPSIDEDNTDDEADGETDDESSIEEGDYNDD